MKLKAKDLRHRISFVFEQAVTNERNVKSKRWIPWKSCYAQANNLFGTEFYAAKRENLENTIVFKIRYNKEIASMDVHRYKIKFGDTLFDIIHIDNVLYKNECLKIKAIAKA